mmetsp:Transcript_47677/g.132688  ORF Transcript_47677/g.132688 Transcript_47677/m.132688 type:complete len:94 (+) Transcript_47677:3258-3539(+)
MSTCIKEKVAPDMGCTGLRCHRSKVGANLAFFAGGLCIGRLCIGLLGITSARERAGLGMASNANESNMSSFIIASPLNGCPATVQGLQLEPEA